MTARTNVLNHEAFPRDVILEPKALANQMLLVAAPKFQINAATTKTPAFSSEIENEPEVKGGRRFAKMPHSQQGSSALRYWRMSRGEHRIGWVKPGT